MSSVIGTTATAAAAAISTLVHITRSLTPNFAYSKCYFFSKNLIYD